MVLDGKRLRPHSARILASFISPTNNFSAKWFDFKVVTAGTRGQSVPLLNVSVGQTYSLKSGFRVPRSLNFARVGILPDHAAIYVEEVLVRSLN